MYSTKFSNGIPNKKAFAHAYRVLIEVVAEVHIAHLFGAAKIIKIMNAALKS